MISKVVKGLLNYIEEGKKQGNGTPLYTINALGSHPLINRTFGGQQQRYKELNDQMLETAFGGHYLLTMLASGSIIRKMLYPEPESNHSLYCDGATWTYFNRHGLVEHGVWDRVDHLELDEHITMENIDHRIYYSASKPFALLAEAKRSEKTGIPVLFVDTDLILKKRHDAILRNPMTVRAAYGHEEALRKPCYPNFSELHLPQGYKLPYYYNTQLLAVNTCLMFFNDIELMKEWSGFFRDLFMENWIKGELDPDTISGQLLGIDQRTFPMVADRNGMWRTSQTEAFLDIIWDPPYFYDNKTGKKAEWHYYTLEHHPEHPDWLQDITHIWINKRNIERDHQYRNYQGCMMLEIILELEPQLERYLRSFDSLKPYFTLQKDYGTLENMMSLGVVSNKLDKER